MIFIVVLVVVALLIYRHFSWRALSWPELALRPPPFQGHRGYWKQGAQENTMASFEAAAQRGLKMVEMDVRLSRDEVPVVFHDADLLRIAGQKRNVQDCTAAELRLWAQAPTLNEVLTSPRVPLYLNIEIKTSRMWEGTLHRQVADLIKKHHAQDRVLFSSFNPLTLWHLSRLLPEVPRALLASQEKEPGNNIYLRRLWLAPYVKIHALHLDHRYVDVKQLESWKKRGVPVALWTVNEADSAKAYLKAGALSIITDSLGENAQEKEPS